MDPVLLCAALATTRRSPDQVLSSLTRDLATRPDSSDQAGWAAPSSGRVLFTSETLSIVGHNDPVQLVLAGEIDICNIPDLTAAMDRAAGGSGVLHIDMADVSFCGLAGLRTIIGLSPPSDNQKRPGRRVVLHHLPANIEKVLRILGWDTVPGLTIDTGTPSTTPQ